MNGITYTHGLSGVKVSKGRVVTGWGGVPDAYKKSGIAYHQATADFQDWKSKLPPKIFNRNATLPLQSVQEVEGLTISLSNYLSQDEACALSATMGGAGPLDPNDFLDPDRTVDECAGYYKGVKQDAPHLGDTLKKLRGINPSAHAWVVDRIFAKATKKNVDLTRNVDEDIAAFYRKVAKTLAIGFAPVLIGVGIFLAWKFMPRK